MPRPITKADIKRWRREGYIFRVYTDDKLGVFVRLGHYSWGHYKWLYSVDAHGDPCLVTKKTIEKRKKLGHPAPAKRKARQRMPEGAFSLEEMELACSIMEELSDG